jgi:murein DD-endopeptidase MepM/ murein hydrolase activator NlpD
MNYVDPSGTTEQLVCAWHPWIQMTICVWVRGPNFKVEVTAPAPAAPTPTGPIVFNVNYLPPNPSQQPDHPTGPPPIPAPGGGGMPPRNFFLWTPVVPCVINRAFSSGHEALDIAANEYWGGTAKGYETQALAFATMEVVKIGTRKGGENFIVLATGATEALPSYYFMYMHVSAREGLKKGDRIPESGIIGRVDGSGNNTGPHIHLEMAMDELMSEPMDPEPFFPSCRRNPYYFP